MATTGSIPINFGSVPGSTYATATVTGQSGILSTSNVEAFIMGNDSTSDHNTTEHQLLPANIRCGNIVVGTGFDVVVSTPFRLTGQFALRWVWA
jgi:hypothetical protein